MKKKPPVLWCVGGSDSSAHAGLQADLRTGQDLDCHVQTIVTCVTAQNSKRVHSVEPVSTQMFDEQWQILLEDVPPDAIKVSLLPSSELVDACSSWLKKMQDDYPTVKIVFDPVMAASSESGNQLQHSDASKRLLEKILPYVSVITPNLLEFTALTGVSPEQPIDVLRTKMGHYLDAYDSYWLIKGGHATDTHSATDWLLQRDVLVGFACEKLTVHNTRGTGCTLSTALACFMAHGYDFLDAMTMAKAYITGALKNGVQIGRGAGPLGRPGWPWQLENLPKVVSPDEAVPLLGLNFAKMDREKMGLYPVVDSVDWLERVLKQGVKIAQLRIKQPDDALSDQIQQAIALGKTYNAQVFINDYWREAIRFGAYGVHLGQEDLALADLKQIQQAGLRLGISTHGYYEIARAQAIKPSYIALGHIFPTQTKIMPSQPQGLMRLSHYVRLLKDRFPTVAIGGINAERLPTVLATGVDSVALVTAITKAANPEAATHSLMNAFVQHAKSFNSEQGVNHANPLE